jgi:catechol 2,3-dioxygenase-like lactoylglutathione lyase family enzyme
MIAELRQVVLDTPDPAKLAAFYAAITGWKTVTDEPGWVTLQDESGGVRLAFQQSPDHQPPRWPDPNFPQQFHIDFTVSDVDAAEQQVLDLGATALPTPADAKDFRVYADPHGHPFCLCWD